jgi:hypothetical protein
MTGGEGTVKADGRGAIVAAEPIETDSRSAGSKVGVMETPFVQLRQYPRLGRFGKVSNEVKRGQMRPKSLTMAGHACSARSWAAKHALGIATGGGGASGSEPCAEIKV